MRIVLRLIVFVAFVAAVVCALAAAGLESPMGVILPLEGVGLGGAVTGLLLGGVAVWRGRKSGARVVVALAGLAILLGVASGGFLVTRTFLAYRTVPVTFVSGDVVLSGDVYLPRGTAAAPAAVLVHGSGRETRNEYAFYARFLARRGIAALAYDKRGTGRSQGSTYAVGYEGYASDAAQAFHLLRQTPGVDSSRTGFLGFSEGEWVAPLAASQVASPAFLVVVGASGLTPAQQSLEEVDLRLARKGFEEADRNAARALYTRLLEYQRSGVLPAGLPEELKEAARTRWFPAAEDLPEEIYPAEEYRWWRGVMDFHAAPLLAQLSCPMLFLKGELDDRSDARQSRERILAAAGEHASSRVAFEVYAGADHSILIWPRGNRTPPPTFPDGYPGRIASWILQAK